MGVKNIKLIYVIKIMLYTKSIFEPKDDRDGTRISVMSRHTLNDGKTPDPRITEESYDEWIRGLAPPDELVGAYYKRGLEWDVFEREYKEHLSIKPVIYHVRSLATRATNQDITILCVEPKGENCHRIISAEECLKYHPELKIEHR